MGRIAMISLHTSPLDQPGTGDAGGMNVYVIELARRLAAAGHRGGHLHPRHRRRRSPPIVEVSDSVLVRHIHAGPFEGLTKGELPGQLCMFAREVLRAEAGHLPGHYDAIHSHYWLSGQVGALARDRWGVPLVHSMHTMAKVKNAALADGDTPEPAGPADRRGAGRRGRRHADRQHRHRGPPADRAVRRRAGARRRRPPRRRPLAVHAPGRAPTPARRLGPAGGRARARCSPAGSSRSRRPTCCCGGRGAARAATRSCAPAWWCRSWAARPAPASSTPSRWPTSSTTSASATWSASCRRSTRPSWPTGARAATLVAVPSYNESLRPGRRRGPGHRHPGRRRRRRRADHRRPRRPLRPAGRRPRAPRLGRRAAPGHRRLRLPRRARRPARWSRPRLFAWDLTAERTLEVYRRAVDVMT